MLTQWSYTSLLLLIVSLFALLLAPKIFDVLGREQRFQRLGAIWLDIVLVAIVVLHILPKVLFTMGFSVLLILVVAYLATVLLHTDHLAKQIGSSSVALVTLGGLLTHGLIDGISIRIVDFGALSTLTATALMLHRLAASLLLWKLVLQSCGKKAAVGALALLGASTVGGYLAGGQAWSLMVKTSLDDYLQVVVAGILLGMIGRIQYSETSQSLPAEC